MSAATEDVCGSRWGSYPLQITGIKWFSENQRQCFWFWVFFIQCGKKIQTWRQSKRCFLKKSSRSPRDVRIHKAAIRQTRGHGEPCWRATKPTQEVHHQNSLHKVPLEPLEVCVVHCSLNAASRSEKTWNIASCIIFTVIRETHRCAWCPLFFMYLSTDPRWSVSPHCSSFFSSC